MMPIRCSRRKSPKTNAYRALVWSVAPSVRPRCHRAYSSHECDSRKAFWSLARGCTLPQSLLSTYWPLSMRCCAHATPSGFTEYEATAHFCPDITRAIRWHAPQSGGTHRNPVGQPGSVRPGGEATDADAAVAQRWRERREHQRRSEREGHRVPGLGGDGAEPRRPQAHPCVVGEVPQRADRAVAGFE